MGYRFLGDRTVRLRYLSAKPLRSIRQTFRLEEVQILLDGCHCFADGDYCHRSNCDPFFSQSHQVEHPSFPRTLFSSISKSSSFNETHSTVQCTFDERHISPQWQKYFDDLSFGLNYHTIRCLLSELIPSLLVALFNIGIITCILCTTAHVKRQRYSPNNPLSLTTGTGSTVRMPGSSPMHLSDPQQPLQRQGSIKGSTQSIASAPFGKMSWMNIVLILHSLLFFLSSSVTSLVFFSTFDILLTHWISVIILATCSLNFYVYCLSGRQFRRELMRIAKHHIRRLRKFFVRTCYTPARQPSPSQNVTKNIYQTVYQTKQRHTPLSHAVKSYPMRQVVKPIE